METETETKKRTYYTPAVKLAIDKYRKNNMEKYNELQRRYYNQAKTDEEWKKQFNDRCRINNQRYRENKKKTNPPKPRGRPKKPVPVVIFSDFAHI